MNIYKEPRTIDPLSMLDYSMRKAFQEPGIYEKSYNSYAASIVGLSKVPKEDIPEVLNDGIRNNFTVKQHLESLKIYIEQA